MSALLYRHSVRLRAARVGWPGARIRAPVVEGGDGGGGAASACEKCVELGDSPGGHGDPLPGGNRMLSGCGRAWVGGRAFFRGSGLGGGERAR